MPEKRKISWTRGSLPVFLVLISICSCARPGLVSRKYNEDFYHVENLLPGGTVSGNQRFLVYGDNQSAWRLHRSFSRESWSSRKMFIFPFYQLYLIGNGLTGAVNYMRMVPDHGGRERRDVRDELYRTARDRDVSFILNVGDICAHDGRIPSHWAVFLKEYREEMPLLDEIPYITISGNHEMTNDIDFGLANYRSIFGRELFDTIEMENALLILLDSNLIIDQKQMIEDDRQDELFRKWFVSGEDDPPSWLEEKISANTRPFIIVAMHHPLLTYSVHSEDWMNGDYGRKLHDKRVKLLRLLASNHVQVVFSGHDHLYQHTVFRSGGGVTNLIIGGGGGGWLRDIIEEKERGMIDSLFSASGDTTLLADHGKFHHFELVDVNKKSITIEVIKSGVRGEDEQLHSILDILPDGTSRKKRERTK
ncbi:MAG: metallophosphoesterase [Candidatus Krumholzibacteria bacterium]|nr:metallophosphoesterase [Candidatus Krumholzibacteria bacterium]